MDITNKTTKPLSVPLPGGKKLFLAPGKTGQVTNRALEHAPIVKLIEAGDIETAGNGAKPRQGGGGNSGSGGGSHNAGFGAMRQSGDR
ncbi:MAG: hypothetical protein ACI8XO_001646 [Verrucomicrobiales bacterium]|jgi:hypothetical protein